MPWSAYKYVIYAERFGWTPDQVDSLPLHVEPWLLPIHNAMEAERQKRDAPPSQPAPEPGVQRFRDLTGGMTT